jgi:tRNA U34 5-carboxymethylaminomethyl modifying GTPase MnmE/TrmE
MLSDTIFAPLTIKGRCSLFVIRISGDRAIECVHRLGIKKNIVARRVILTKIYYKNDVLDKALVLY